MSRRWKDLLELFTMIYGKYIYESICTFKSTPKIGSQNWFLEFQKPSVGWVQSWSLDQLSRLVLSILELSWSLRVAVGKISWSSFQWYITSAFIKTYELPNLTLKMGSQHWILEISKTKCWLEINTFKIEPENGGPRTKFWRLSVGCESWSLDQLHGVLSPNPLTYRGCVSNHWKDLIMLFKSIYSLLIHIAI